MTSLTMSVSGEGIVSHVRNMVLSETSYSEAKGYLEESSLDNKTVESIMQGIIDVKDSSDGHIKLVDEPNERYLRDLNYIYRNYIYSDGEYYKAYAVVDSFGYIDDFAKTPHRELTSYFIEVDECDDAVIAKVSSYINSHIDVQRQQITDKKIRALHYADDFQNDVVVETVVNFEKSYLLCKKVDFDLPDFLNIEEKNISDVYESIANDPYDIGFNKRGYKHSYMWYEEEMFGSYYKSNKVYPREFINDDGTTEDYRSGSGQIVLEELKQVIKQRVLNDENVIKEGFIDIKDDKNIVIATVPKLPFMHWVFSRVGYKNTLPKYEAYSPLGMKGGHTMDCRYHSDWMIAADLDLEKDYETDSPVYTHSNVMRFRLLSDTLDFEVAVLSSGDNKEIEGRVFVCNKDNANEVKKGNILVIPDGSVDYDEHIRRASKNGRCGIISAKGSKVMHVAIVAREKGYIVFLDPDILNKVNDFDTITMYPKQGRYRMDY